MLPPEMVQVQKFAYVYEAPAASPSVIWMTPFQLGMGTEYETPPGQFTVNEPGELLLTESDIDAVDPDALPVIDSVPVMVKVLIVQ